MTRRPLAPAEGGACPEEPDTARFDVAELFSGDDDGLLWLTLGFSSPAEPLDVLHIVCGKAATGIPDQDALYLERSDQDLACGGEVQALVVRNGGLVLTLTPTGAAALELPLNTCFTFNEQPALLSQAVEQLALMAACGQSCIALPGAN